VRVDVYLPEHGFREDISLIGIKEYEADEYALAEYRQGVTRGVSRSADTNRVFVVAVLECQRVVDDPRQAFFEYGLQGGSV
jgi:hypothetical protein